jgi:tetratricopeptide (TPR) repeat protein
MPPTAAPVSRSAPPPVPSAPPGAPVDISEEVEEMEFFLEQGLVDEARAMFHTLSARYPDNPELLRLKPAMEGARRSASEAPHISTAAPLAMSELSSSLQLEDITEDHSSVEIDEVFTQFKAGVEAQISKSDHTTHFDLGQAYKDMGLWDDAIGEFRIAAEDPTRKISSELMIGMCHVGAGRFEDAISIFDDALRVRGLQESEKLALLYEKGKVYELMGDGEKALDIYNEILNTDPGFADVVDRIDSLE